MGSKKNEIVHYAALPFRMEDGHPMVLLVTSRETKRWIIPKGKPEKKLLPHEVAAREAFEEAGVHGKITDEAFATFDSTKRLDNGREVPIKVRVYLLEITEILAEWPEKHERERRWVSPGEAALLASEPGLVGTMLDFSALWS
ncbi:MAG TPA: NUDIX hydrolase [Candidatus Omnitrophota bacterium]|nr:NUDIX hydrolase [Candidatus Omnitrophota bacterium]